MLADKGKTYQRKIRWEDDGVSIPWMASLLGVYFAAMLNKPFWNMVTQFSPYDGFQSIVVYGLLFVALTSACAFVFNALWLPGIGKPLVMTLLLLSSILVFFMETYGALFNPQWVIESREHWTNVQSGLGWHVVLYGFAPSMALFMAPIGRRNGWREVRRRMRFAVISLGLAIAAIGVQYDAVQSLMPLYELLNPLAVVKVAVALIHVYFC